MISYFNEKVIGDTISFNDKVTGDKPPVPRQGLWKNCLPLPQILNQLMATLPFVAPDFESDLTILVLEQRCTV